MCTDLALWGTHRHWVVQTLPREEPGLGTNQLTSCAATRAVKTLSERMRRDQRCQGRSPGRPGELPGGAGPSHRVTAHQGAQLHRLWASWACLAGCSRDAPHSLFFRRRGPCGSHLGTCIRVPSAATHRGPAVASRAILHGLP